MSFWENVLFVSTMIILSTAAMGGLLYWAATLLIFRCSLRPGAIVRLAPDENAPIYYVCEEEESLKRYKYFESLRHPGWFALKKGGFVQFKDLKSMGVAEYERKITTA